MKKKGIVLAGGSGTRLYPLTKVTNKALLPIGEQPMIMHILDVFKLSDIKDIMIVTNTEHMDHIVRLLGSGREFGYNLTYKIQDTANGIAAALGLCSDFARDSKIAVLLGDNIFENKNELSDTINVFMNSDSDYHFFTKQVPDPQRFGVAKYNSNNQIVDIIEKPTTPPSNDAVVGLYLYSNEVFQVIETLSPSSRGEYEISDVNSFFVKNRKGSSTKVQGDWVDAGTHESYKKANKMIWGIK